ncbi:MAG: NAD-dependent epimerase/dehydratase family protein [Steroidobacteraceae bacterium]
MFNRVLLTGANGFTGHYVRRVLRAKGDEVLGVELQGSAAEAEDSATVQCDLTSDLGSLRSAVNDFRPTHVLHLAALSHVTAFSPLDYYRVNVLGTENLLSLLRECGSPVKKIVIASSANVYGNAASSPIKEATPPSPINHYAASKFAMECIARTEFSRLPIILARPFNYTGRGQSELFLVPKIVRHFVERREFIVLGDTNVARDISDVRFVADAYARLLDTQDNGFIVNICSGRAVSVRALVDMMSQIAGWPIDVQRDDSLVRVNEVKSLCGANARLREAIGEFSVPPLIDTLTWMYAARPQT